MYSTTSTNVIRIRAYPDPHHFFPSIFIFSIFAVTHVKDFTPWIWIQLKHNADVDPDAHFTEYFLIRITDLKKLSNFVTYKA